MSKNKKASWGDFQTAIFQVALLGNATSIIVAHNHPSGNLSISKADETLTQRIKKAGEMLRVTLEDQLIKSFR